VDAVGRPFDIRPDVRWVIGGPSLDMRISRVVPVIGTELQLWETGLMENITYVGLVCTRRRLRGYR
jgi:hypothetical protein